jgi:hypothetical protein
MCRVRLDTKVWVLTIVAGFDDADETRGATAALTANSLRAEPLSMTIPEAVVAAATVTLGGRRPSFDISLYCRKRTGIEGIRAGIAIHWVGGVLTPEGVPSGAGSG